MGLILEDQIKIINDQISKFELSTSNKSALPELIQSMSNENLNNLKKMREGIIQQAKTQNHKRDVI